MAATLVVRRHPIALIALLATAYTLVALTPSPLHAQWTAASVNVRASFRGLSVAPDGTIWLGGTHGTILRSTDAGSSWETDSIAGASSFDLRGVAAIDSRSAYAMVAKADTGRVYKTTDAGHTWRLQYRDERKGVFLDGIECWDPSRCLAAGDPIDGRFLVIATQDGGTHWAQLATADAPTAIAGEGIFAASASSVVIGSGGRAWIATGGGQAARVWRSSDYGAHWQVSATPLTAGTASAGVFSIAICRDGRVIAVGGDYRAPKQTGSHVAVSTDDGATWIAGDPKQVTPYLSGATCAALLGKTIIVAVGPDGSFISSDAQQWVRVGTAGFNAVAVARMFAVAAGDTGAVAHAPLASLGAP